MLLSDTISAYLQRQGACFLVHKAARTGVQDFRQAGEDVLPSCRPAELTLCGGINLVHRVTMS